MYWQLIRERVIRNKEKSKTTNLIFTPSLFSSQAQHHSQTLYLLPQSSPSWWGMGFVALHNPSWLPLLLQGLPLLQDTVLHKILLHISFTGPTVLHIVLQCSPLPRNEFLLEKSLSMWVPQSSYRSELHTPHSVAPCRPRPPALAWGHPQAVAQISAPWHGLLQKTQGILCLEHLLSRLLHWTWCLQSSFYDILEINRIQGDSRCCLPAYHQ